MLFLHEIHAVPGQTGAAFETLVRERWAPAVASADGMRLVWCVRSMPGGVSYPELITMTALADGAALERFCERVRHGDLRDPAAELEQSRADITRRILAPMVFSPLTVDLDAIPAVPPSVDGPGEMYIHDFVPPRLGMQRTYETAMREVFMAMIEMEGIPIVIWAGLETIAGGGPIPESLMISHIQGADAAIGLLSREVPREEVTPGSWMFEGLKLRDTWTSRLVRSVSWSPIR